MVAKPTISKRDETGTLPGRLEVEELDVVRFSEGATVDSPAPGPSALLRERLE
jgi:hypothetical protein